MPSLSRKESIGLEIRGPGVQYSLVVTFCYWNFLFSCSKASDALLPTSVTMGKLDCPCSPLTCSIRHIHIVSCLNFNHVNLPSGLCVFASTANKKYTNDQIFFEVFHVAFLVLLNSKRTGQYMRKVSAKLLVSGVFPKYFFEFSDFSD